MLLGGKSEDWFNSLSQLVLVVSSCRRGQETHAQHNSGERQKEFRERRAVYRWDKQQGLAVTST